MVTTDDSETTFLIDVSRVYKNKTGYQASGYKLNTSFQTEQHTPRSLVDNVIRKGFPYTFPHWKRSPDETGAATRGVSTPKHEENFRSCQVLTADDDSAAEGVINFWCNDAWFAERGNAFVESVNSKANAQKGHPIIIFDKPITDCETWKLYLKAFAFAYPRVDTAMKNVTLIYYNAEDATVHEIGNVCPVEVYEREIVAPYLAHLAELEAERERKAAEVAQRITLRPATPTSGRANAYAQRIIDSELNNLATVAKGQPITINGKSCNRQQTALHVITRLASLANATWHTYDTSNLQSLIHDALALNGYTAAYGNVDRLFNNWDSVTPAHEPQVLRHEVDGYFSVGCLVDVMHPSGRKMVTGKVERFTTLQGDDFVTYWVSGGRYPKAWLRHSGSEAAEVPAPQTIKANAGFLTLDTNILNIQSETEDRDALALPSSTSEAPLYADSHGRDIYAAVRSTRKQQSVDVPDGMHLSDIDFDLPNKAIIYANTGIGKTTYARNLEGRTVFVCPTVPALLQMKAEMDAAGRDCDLYYQHVKTAHSDSTFIITTYDSLRSVLPLIDASQFNLVVDELHKVASDGSYRAKAMDAVLDCVNGQWKRVLLMTGTPLPIVHPDLANFTEVRVSSNVRIQNAVRIVYKKEIVTEGGIAKTVGKKIDAFRQRATSDNTHLVYVESKGRQLDSTIAALLGNGFKRDEILCVNADTRDTEGVRQLIDTGYVPNGIRVIIGTSILLEAINVYSTVDFVHIYSHLEARQAQQLVNRFRTKASKSAYFYNASEGKATAIDERAFVHHALNEARVLVDKLNAYGTNPNDDSAMATIQRHEERKHTEGAYALARIVSNSEDKAILEGDNKRYGISYTGVSAYAFQLIREHGRNNPEVWKNQTRAYNWSWEDDLHTYDIPVPKEAAEDKAIRTQLKEERKERFIERVTSVKETDIDAVNNRLRNNAFDSETADTVRECLAVHSCLEALDSKVPFSAACDMVIETEGSGRKLERLKRQIRNQHDIKHQTPYASAINEAFAIDEIVTSKELHTRLCDVYGRFDLTQHNLQWIETPTGKAKQRLSHTKATQIIGDYYELVRTKKEVDGKRVNAYKVTARLSDTIFGQYQHPQAAVQPNTIKANAACLTLDTNILDNQSETDEIPDSMALALIPFTSETFPPAPDDNRTYRPMTADDMQMMANAFG